MKRARWDLSSDEDENGDDREVQPPHESYNSHSSESNMSVHKNNNSTDTEDNHTLATTSISLSNCHTDDKLPKHNPLLSGCRSVYDSYERLARLDEGTYGIVWKAQDLATNEIVALKQIKFDSSLKKEGFPIAALREIGVLLSLSHECIVTVKEMVVGDGFDKVFMVMEYMEMDLKEAMEKSGSSPFPQSEMKSMLYQILSATHHIHQKWYLHRDMKTSNILVHKSGKIALCDFGLARKYQMPLKKMTQMVITLWYRPPELMFGETVYGPEVDMWSVGCIFGELLKKDAILQGQGEMDQINSIFKLVGAPDEENWPEFTDLPNARILRWKNKNVPLIHETFPINSFSGGQTFLDQNGFDLLTQLLSLNPRRRISAGDALNHKYFQEGVEKRLPCFNIT